MKYVYKEKDMSDNKKCPFCNGEGENLQGLCNYIKCQKCGAIAGIDVWSTRAPQADISSDDEIGYIYLQPECCADSHIGMLWSEKDHGECKHGGVWRKFVSREPLKPNTTRRKT
jgi:hypothetical protein